MNKKINGIKKLFFSSSLPEIDRQFFFSPKKKVILTGNHLTIPEIFAVSKHNVPVNFTNQQRVIERIEKSYHHMIEDIKKGIPIYGCNTGYGAQSSRVLDNGSAQQRLKVAKKISEGITHVDVSVGPVFEKEVTRGAMLIRINMLMAGVSAVKLQDLNIYRLMINHQVTPIVNQYGGIGASGDLAHNCRILNAARQVRGVKVWDKNGRVKEAASLLKEKGIPRLELDPKAGLGFVNGDNFSTALAALLTVDTLQALLIACATAAMTIEVLRGTDRSFHPLLSGVRPHLGQEEMARLFHYLLKGTKLAYQEMKGHQERPKGMGIQDAYSLRCLSQYYGIGVEKIKSFLEIITINANSVSDNPLWVTPEYATKKEKSWQWVSGGNFLAMHMVEVMDDLRKIMTQIVKLNDRHLARLVNPGENNGLPANLSDSKAVTQCTFKGVQIQSGMFEVYSSLLSLPVSTFFGVHEESNQDISSHALTSGIMALENLRLVRYSLAQNLLALVQAVDLRGGPKDLSPQTRLLYNFIRERVKYVEKERPLSQEIENLYRTIKDGELIVFLRKKIFSQFE